MMKQKRPLGRSITVSMLALLGAIAAQPVAAQEGELDRDRLTQYALAHNAMNDARDEFHGKVARVHDEEGRLRAREEMEVQVTSILAAQAMTRKQYDDITLRISLDGETRLMFEEILVALAEVGDDGP